METDIFRELKVVSIEQAIVAPYLTFRLAQDGMEILRIENPASADPDRYIGPNCLGEEGMNTYFFAINGGKKAITLNLADPRGRELLKEIIAKLPADIFITNQLPINYNKLGIDYETLSAVKPDLIWLGISGFGPQYDEVAYDPILQARGGIMEINGEENGEPLTLGIHLSDMGASEHAYGLIMKALLNRAVTGKGSRIDLSMFDSTVSWLTVPICLSHNFKYHYTRRGNTHKFFAPASVFRTRDGYVYITVGNERQWQSLTNLLPFQSLAKDEYAKNAGRIADVDNLNRAMNDITQTFLTAELVVLLKEAKVAVSKINNIKEVVADPFVKGKMLYTEDVISGLKLGLAPPPFMTPFLEEQGKQLSFPPRIGEHNTEIYHHLLCLDNHTLEKLRYDAVI
jgi:formyl-CoA transferase